MKVSDLNKSCLVDICEEYNIYNIENTRNKKVIKIGNKDFSYIKRDLFLINPREYKEKTLKNVNDILYKGKSIEEWKDIRIKKLNEVLINLKNKSYSNNEIGKMSWYNFEYNKEVDRIYAIDELEELIKFIKNIVFEITDSTSEYICKLYLILNKLDCYSFTKKLNGRLCEIRSFRKKGDVYVRGLDKVLFFPYISVQYGVNYFDKAILYEYNKKTDLGILAYTMKLRNERNYSRINNWRSNKIIMEYLF